ncbi:sugar nucleotide-binding protein [Candidatus Woesebacteria bacterium]|nr:sugar nucleotide-binding protein [Candidatus Woesebacteria bacterium]
MKILIIGASGFLGNKLYTFLEKRHHVFGTSRHSLPPFIKLDLKNRKETINIINSIKPNVIIFAAGIARPNEVEKNLDDAFKINVSSLVPILKTINKLNIKVIFLSSIYVFDGKKNKYFEQDISSPFNLYGKLKIESENLIKKISDHLIIRSDMIYGYDPIHKNNGFIGTLINNKTIHLNSKIKRKPIFIDDFNIIIEKLMLENINGIIHLTGKESVTLSDFANNICDKLKISCNVVKLENGENVPVLASNRLKYSFTKIKKALEITWDIIQKN